MPRRGQEHEHDARRPSISLVAARCGRRAARIGCGGQGADGRAQYSASYSLQNLGSIPGLPTPYGGLRFVDANTILIGGAANSAPGRLYTIDVTRDAGGHITGFVGTAVVYGNVGENNDGGVTFGPGGVLFTTRYNQNEMGQTKPGSLDEDKVTLLTPLALVANTTPQPQLERRTVRGPQRVLLARSCAESGTALRLARRARAVRLHRARTARHAGGGTAPSWTLDEQAKHVGARSALRPWAISSRWRPSSLAVRSMSTHGSTSPPAPSSRRTSSARPRALRRPSP